MITTEGTLFEAFLAGLVACAATGMGSALAALKRFVDRTIAKGLAFGGGVMLSASLFSLILPGLDAGKKVFESGLVSIIVSLIGITLGAFLIVVLEKLHTDKNADVGKIWAFIWAITLHNFPEGLAIGVAYGGTVSDARKLTAAISLQDIPEGAVVAILLMAILEKRIMQTWKKRSLAFTGGLASGVAEPIASVIGKTSIGISQSVLPLGMAIAAGAMLFVVIHNIIPDAKSLLGSFWTTIFCILLGFSIMSALDIFLPLMFSYFNTP